MRVITRKALEQFWVGRPDAESPLRFWLATTYRGVWRNSADVKKTLGQTDTAKVKSGQTVHVFDVGGNKYRLIARISFKKQTIYALRVLTHKEYDTNRWKSEL